MFKSVSTKAEVIDLSNSKPGDKIVIEHLPTSPTLSRSNESRRRRRPRSAAKGAKRLARKELRASRGL
ncbi:MAG: hypothetical protein R2710_24330 [Acidimicrobiales bacterium]